MLRKLAVAAPAPTQPPPTDLTLILHKRSQHILTAKNKQQLMEQFILGGGAVCGDPCAALFIAEEGIPTTDSLAILSLRPPATAIHIDVHFWQVSPTLVWMRMNSRLPEPFPHVNAATKAVFTQLGESCKQGGGGLTYVHSSTGLESWPGDFIVQDTKAFAKLCMMK